MAVTTAQKVAEGFLAFCSEHGDYLCNLKLQKLLYYAQGWYLAFNDKPLYDDDICAWIHGPVVPTVYNHYKAHSWQPLPGLPIENYNSLPNDVQEHIEEVWSAYGWMSSYDLEMLTHTEAPWINARGNLSPDEPSQAVLSLGDMTKFFQSKISDVTTNTTT